MDLTNYIYENYSSNQPIVFSKLKEQLNEKIPYNTLKSYIKRLVDSKKLCKYDNGIYFYKDETSIFSYQTISIIDVISELYLKENDKMIGFTMGLTFANELGLTTQVPNTIEIMTNNESSKKRDITLGGFPIILRKSRLEINSENERILQLLELLTNYDKICEVDVNVFIKTVKKYMDDNKISTSDLLKYVKYFPNKTAKNIIESGLLYAS